MKSIKFQDFLSPHSSTDKIVSIQIEPNTVFLEEGRHAKYLNFDFIVKGLSDRNLLLKFIKVAVYDKSDNLLTYQYRNHNAVGFPGIQTIGTINLSGDEKFDIPNPFYQFPKDMPIDHLRFMFTWLEQETKKEYYYGNIIVKPVVYKQKAKLQIPLKGMMTILDGHDYYSHHRRFEMTLVREFTAHKFTSNFSRFALDFVLIGEDGNLSQLEIGEHLNNYDFHFKDVRQFYTHEAPVYAPGDGIVVEIVDHLEDLYDRSFRMEKAVQEDRIQEIAGNYIIIQHNQNEFSHLFHLLKGSACVSDGQPIKSGEKIAQVGFSGAATTYSHLHYQLMDGADFLNDQALPCKFTDITLIENGIQNHYLQTTVDTGDFILNG